MESFLKYYAVLNKLRKRNDSIAEYEDEETENTTKHRDSSVDVEDQQIEDTEQIRLSMYAFTNWTLTILLESKRS